MRNGRPFPDKHQHHFCTSRSLRWCLYLLRICPGLGFASFVLRTLVDIKSGSNPPSPPQPSQHAHSGRQIQMHRLWYEAQITRSLCQLQRGCIGGMSGLHYFLCSCVLQLLACSSPLSDSSASCKAAWRVSMLVCRFDRDTHTRTWRRQDEAACPLAAFIHNSTPRLWADERAGVGSCFRTWNTVKWRFRWVLVLWAEGQFE